MTETARYFCDEHLKLLSESQVEKFVCFWCAQNKIAEREQEAATAALEQATQAVATEVARQAEFGMFPSIEDFQIAIRAVAIGNDKK